MAFCDFVIRYDPEKDTSDMVAKKIIYSILVNRLKQNKPAVCFLSGDSGEGKSLTAVTLADIILEMQGVEIRDFFEDINVCTPIQYPEKLDKILYDKLLKKVNVLIMHEAREVVKAKLWHSFQSQAIADVNAMSRAVKRLCTIIISQFIRDITTDVRYTITFYMKVRRPRKQRARLYIYVMWKDDRDLEKPKLRKRKLSGYLQYPSGRRVRFVPEFIELPMPAKDLVERFDKMDFESKTVIIRKKLNRLLNDMRSEIGEENKKVDTMVGYYTQDQERLSQIGKRLKRKWKIRPEFKAMHELTDQELKLFESKLNDAVSAKGWRNQEEDADYGDAEQSHEQL